MRSGAEGEVQVKGFGQFLEALGYQPACECVEEEATSASMILQTVSIRVYVSVQNDRTSYVTLLGSR